jgi:hypothetical protein
MDAVIKFVTNTSTYSLLELSSGSFIDLSGINYHAGVTPINTPVLIPECMNFLFNAIERKYHADYHIHPNTSTLPAKD